VLVSVPLLEFTVKLVEAICVVESVPSVPPVVDLLMKILVLAVRPREATVS
jgi:hypothetical protein